MAFWPSRSTKITAEILESFVPSSNFSMQHAAGVGNLLRGVDEYLLADQFGDDEALGLIGDLVLGKILGALGQRVDHGGEQLFLAELFFGGDGNDLREVEALRPRLDDRQQLRFLEEIDLVQQQEGFDLGALDDIEDELVSGAELLGDIDDEQDEVAAFERIVDLLHHALVELVLRLVYAGSVHEDDLPGGTLGLALYVDDAGDAVARGLRLVGDDGEFFADQRIEQSGFARIGTADDGYES